MQDRRLHWVGRNRARPDRTKNAGGFIADLAAQLESGHGELMVAMEAISSVVDADFCRHCTVGTIGNGTLTIHVDSPGLVAPMRVRWAGVILEAVQQVREFSKIRRISFELGKGGASFCTDND